MGKQVAAATTGDSLVNLDLWVVSSLKRRLSYNKMYSLDPSSQIDFLITEMCPFIIDISPLWAMKVKILESG